MHRRSPLHERVPAFSLEAGTQETGQLATGVNETRLSHLVNPFLDCVRDSELVNGDRTFLADAMDTVECLVLMDVEPENQFRKIKSYFEGRVPRWLYKDHIVTSSEIQSLICKVRWACQKKSATCPSHQL